MSFKDEEKIQALRDRLYARGKAPDARKKYVLKDRPKDVRHSWDQAPKTETPAAPAVQPRPASPTASTPETPQSIAAAPSGVPTEGVSPTMVAQSEGSVILDDMKPRPQKRHRYRIKILLAGFAFFVLSVLVSSVFFVTGGNSISGENIAVSITGPFTIGGGEIIPLQVAVTNENTVPIDSATLIVTYPRGTQSSAEEGRELYVERLALNTIQSGDTLNVPLRAVVFGEENEEKIITAEVEYRVQGSNSTFAKESEPLRFKISSSPVTISVQSLHKVSAGQETDIELTVTSNAPNPLTDLLVKAEYPNGFDYSSSNPAPISGKNVWRIDSLEPEKSAKIRIRGVVVGEEADEFAMHFSIGVPSDQDRTTLASIFSTATTDFLIEQPFLNVTLEINGESGSTIAAEPGEAVQADIVVKNTLSDTIYDGRVELGLSGNALTDYRVTTNLGFYDSGKNTVYWNSSDVGSLKEIPPGGSVRLGIRLLPDPDVERTPQLGFEVNASARRVTEGRATEELVGTASGVVKVASIAQIITEVGRDTSIFKDTGPLPPVAEEETTFTLTFFTQNGSNDMGDVEVTATLPTYVKWLNKTSGAGEITFNETSRVVTWKVGEVEANQSKIAAAQVSLLPSVSQIGTTPTLLGEQRFRGTDRFAGSIVRTNFPPLTTRLAEEAGYPDGVGIVQGVDE